MLLSFFLPLQKKLMDIKWESEFRYNYQLRGLLMDICKAKQKFLCVTLHIHVVTMCI